jgi:glucokinase
MPDQGHGVVVGLDNGGTTNNATVLDSAGRFLVDHMLETHSLVQEGPEKAIEALARAFAGVLEVTGTPTGSVLAVGLDTPGPASANGVISARGAVNFLHPAWSSITTTRTPPRCTRTTCSWAGMRPPAPRYR